MILNKERKNLYCFNPFKTVLFPLQPEERTNPNDEIVDFVTLPYMQAVSMSRNGMICLHSYEKTDPNSPKIESTIKLDLSLGEDCYSITVCPLFKYLAISVIDFFKQESSRVFVVALSSSPNQLQLKSSLRMKPGIRTPPLNLVFYDYFHSHILISGITNSKPTSVLTFIYDTQEA